MHQSRVGRHGKNADKEIDKLVACHMSSELKQVPFNCKRQEGSLQNKCMCHSSQMPVSFIEAYHSRMAARASSMLEVLLALLLLADE